MISIDANILVRAFLGDDPKQSAACAALLEQSAGRKNAFYVSQIALMEFVWVLKSKKWPRSAIATSLQTLLVNSHFVFSNTSVLLKALSLYQAGKADYSDYVIYVESHMRGVKKLATYDAALLEECGAFAFTPKELR